MSFDLSGTYGICFKKRGLFWRRSNLFNNDIIRFGLQPNVSCPDIAEFVLSGKIIEKGCLMSISNFKNQINAVSI